MKETLPLYIYIIFIVTTMACLALLVLAIKKSRRTRTRRKANTVMGGLIFWLIFQAAFTILKVYNRDLDVMPPKLLMLGALPAFVFILLLFVLPAGRKFIDSLPLKYVTWIHVVRVPVEITLYLLMLYRTVPVLMTFEGRNYDILAGLTAPLIVYFGHTTHWLSRRMILAWNIICLGLLINIVVNAILSTPFPFQQFAFNQPNVAVLHFPFSWLPVFIVPVVFFAHMVAIRQALTVKKLKA